MRMTMRNSRYPDDTPQDQHKLTITVARMKVSANSFLALTCGILLVATACGGSGDESAPRTPQSAPEVVLTPEEKQVWAPLPPDRSAVPVLLYHGIGPESGFSNATDASYGIGFDDFAKQMTMIKHAGYQTIDLSSFLSFLRGDPVELPPRPLLLTFDDARVDSWTGSDGILHELGFTAVMFVDVGRVDDGNPEYLTWQELQTVQASGHWQLQLHSGHGHQQIQYGPGANDYGAYYAYEHQGESFDGWRTRVRSDIEWGQDALADDIPDYRPLAFAPPYGNYGQQGTNDPRIPDDLLSWLTQRYGTVFTQDQNALAHQGSQSPLGRIQVTRDLSGGDLHTMLLSGGP
jgi:peptidoglycan/xylan/chitin deacetylase (PgdA/CDA1 family)